MKWLTQLAVLVGVSLAQSGALASPAVTNLTENRFLQFDDYLLTNNAPATWVHEGPLPASGSPANRALLAGTNHYHRAGWVLRSCRTGTSAYLGYAVPPRIPTTVPTYPAIASNLAANLQNAYGAFVESPALTSGVGVIYFDAINNNTGYTNQLTVELSTNMINVSTSEVVPTVLPPSTNGLAYVWAPLDVHTLAAAGSNDLLRYSRLLNVRQPAKVRVRQSNGVQAGLSSYDGAFLVVDNLRLSPPAADVAITGTTVFADSGSYRVRCFVSNVDASALATNRAVTVTYRWPGLTPPADAWTNVPLSLMSAGDGNGNGERYEVLLAPQPYGGSLELYVTCAFDGYWYAATDYTGLGYAGYPSENRSPYVSSVHTQALAGVGLRMLTVNNGSGSGAYTNGQLVAIAATSLVGQAFSRWTGATQYVADALSPSTTVSMPDADIAVTANFTNIIYTLTVTGGSGSGLYTYGQVVPVSVTPVPDTIFDRWTGATQYVANVFAASTTVTMPAASIAISAATISTYALTVDNGSGDGVYTNGQQIAITADSLPGKVFLRWSGAVAYVANSFAASTTVTMPGAPITVTAVYADLYALTVNSGSGSGSYTNGQRIAVAATGIAGQIFTRWTGQTVYLDDAFASNTVVTMPAQTVSVTANYIDSYVLAVTNGNGGGTYTNGQSVTVYANPPALGQVFVRWAGATQYLADASAALTQLTMPSLNIGVAATYSNLFYTLTVDNGTGSGSYTNGRVVPIAATVPVDKTFVRWSGDTAYVTNTLTPNSAVIMPAAAVTVSALLSSETSLLAPARFLHFNDYTQTNAPNPVWVHEGPLPGSGSATVRALLAGTNHYHQTGWRLYSCRAGCSAYVAAVSNAYVPPIWPTTAPAYPTVASNLAANLRYESGAAVESPVFSNGVGTVYFDAIVNTLDAGQLTVEAATRMRRTNDYEEIDTLFPPDGSYEYVWEPVDVLNLTNQLYRYIRTLNHRTPIKLRMHRTGDLNGSISRDSAFIVIDNVRISVSPSDVDVTKTDNPFEPGFPNVYTGLTVRCYVSNTDTNVPTDSRVVKCVYRWRFLNQQIQAWRTNTMTRVEGTGDGRGNGERFELVIPPYSEVGDLEYFFVCDFEGYLYKPVDYTGLNYVYPSESLSPRRLRGIDGEGTEFAERLREFASHYKAMYAEVDFLPAPISMMLVGQHEWRAMVPLAGTGLTNLTWRFKAVGKYQPYSEAATSEVTYWAGLSDVQGGRVPYGGLCVMTSNETARLNVLVDTGNYVLLTLNTETMQYLASRGEYQNFNNWPAPVSIFSQSNGQDPKSSWLHNFNEWPVNAYEYGLDDEGQGIALEAFATGYVNSTNVYTRIPFTTMNSWQSASSGYAVERTLVDNSINAIPGIPKFRNQALRLKGGDGTLGLGYVHNMLATLPDGLKEFSVRCRVGEDLNPYDVSYYRYGFANSNYLVRATAKAVDDVHVSPGNPSVSLVGYYRDPDNFYEYRVTQIVDTRDSYGAISDKRARLSVYKWKDGIPVELTFTNVLLNATPLTSISDAAPLEMRVYGQTATNTLIYCSYGTYANIIKYSDAQKPTSAPFKSGSFGFISAECYASCSAVLTQSLTTDATPLVGTEVPRLRTDTYFDGDVLDWYLPNGRYLARADVTPKGIYSIIPSQQVGLYVQPTSYGSDEEPAAAGSASWTLRKTLTVNNYSYQAFTETFNRWDSRYVMLQMMGGTADVTVDELAVSSWHGVEAGLGFSDNYDWVATEAWVVSNSTSDAHAIQMDHSRANPGLPQMIRGLRIDTGLGQMEFDYRVFRAPAKLTVQYAPVGFEGNEEDWVDVQSYVVSNTLGWTHTSTYLGLSIPGYFRVLNNRQGGYTNAWVEIDNVKVWDEPPITNNSWIAYNVKITSTDTNRVLIDELKSCFLNNSQTVEAAPPQTQFLPYLMSPELPKGFGGITFYARAYTNNQPATLYLYGSKHGWNAPETNWTLIATFANITNGLYKRFTFEPEDGREYDAIKLGTLTSGGARRVCLDEVTVYEPIFPGFDIVNVRLLRRGTVGELEDYPQPQEAVDVAVEARIANQQMTPSNITMYVSYFVGTNGWGIGNWNYAQAKTRRMLPVTTNANETLYQTVPEGFVYPDLPYAQTGGISGQDRDQVVQYYVWATFMGGIPLETRQTTFVNPPWYYPVDLNAKYQSQGWSPYYFVYGVPLGAVWINEVNAIDYVEDAGGQQVFGIWDNNFIEIAAPAWLDLAGWSVDLVKGDGYVTRTINLPSGLPEQTPVQNGYTFFVIGDAYQPYYIPALPKKDYGYPDLMLHMPKVSPGGLRLRRPLGMYEQAIAYDWDPSPAAGLASYGLNWATNDPQRKFVYVGREHNGASLARVGIEDSTNSWAFPQSGIFNLLNNSWTPGAPNIGQQYPFSGDTLVPGSSNVYVTSLLNRDKGTQNGRRTTYYQVKLRKDSSTNIYYQADEWYRLTSVRTNQAEVLPPSSELVSYDLLLEHLQQSVDVAVDISLRSDLSEISGDSRILDWVLGFEDGELVPMYYEGRQLRLEEMYWLDANPTVSNTFEMAITRFVVDPSTNFHLTVKMALNGAKKTELQGDAVLKLEAKGALVEREWKMMAQYSLNSGSFDGSNTCRLFVPNPFDFLLSDVDPRNLLLRWVIEWRDPRVTVQSLLPNE